MKVGFIGLGTMGSSMAMNVAAGGHELVVFDIDEHAAKPHLEAGADWAASARDVAEASEVVFTSLPGPAEVEAVALGDDGLLQGMGEDQAFFDLSTNSPTVMRRIHAAFAERGIQLLDAPVSGGPGGARTGKLAIWVGGDEATFERHLPLLHSIGDQPFYVGAIGAGSIAKLVHNCSGYIIQNALAETFTMGVKAGLDPADLWQAVRHGAVGRRRTFDGLAPQFLQGKYDPPDFALALARKDVNLACELGREVDVPMRLANMALQELTEAVNRGWGQRDSRVAMLLQEERAGVEVKVEQDRITSILRDG
ncbi:MAG: NAD(P)-dependent oxidoreductase [Gammaproteobacteria bacterium]|nr:NAD(P)-dependent oxidoreductase [Gammaproteobacteria bacterium]